jgi:hypothetical protein
MLLVKAIERVLCAASTIRNSALAASGATASMPMCR